MPLQYQALMNDTNLEPISMYLKGGDRCVVNCGEGLAAVDFGGDVSLAEKLVRHGAGVIELVEQKLLRHGTGTTEWMEHKLSLSRRSRGIVSGCYQSGTLRHRARGWSPKDSMESVVTWRRRGAGGVALAMLQEGSAGGRGDWATTGGRYREGTQQIAGARDYISEGKERLAVLTEAGSGRRLSPCGCCIMTHPSKEGVQQRAQAAEEIRSGGRKHRSSRHRSDVTGGVESSSMGLGRGTIATRMVPTKRWQRLLFTERKKDMSGGGINERRWAVALTGALDKENRDNL
ncbi:hypothetical protein GW17_00034162 [Ensete ventricosum]|nr:hypothetical protein GW17_00034162 [Ensete ventricosum]